MSVLTLRAQAFGPLQKVEWTIPEGVSAIVGPNRVGKSTLLSLPRFLHLSIHESLNEAVRKVFDGPAYLRNLSALKSVLSGVGISIDSHAWNVHLSFAGSEVPDYCAEEIRTGSSEPLKREFGSANGHHENRLIPLGKSLIPRICWDRIINLPQDRRTLVTTSTDRNHAEEALAPIGGPLGLAGIAIASASSDFYTYRTYEYQLGHLFQYGSRQSAEKALSASGENIFPLLRNWRDNSDTESHYIFVLDTLREAFPHVKKVDFEQAGQSVTMAIRDGRWSDRKLPISRESTGLGTALLQLAAVASCPKDGLVTIDELETSLHPRAIQVLLEAFRRRAREQNLRIVLATQSETVLDQFHDCPEQIQVLEPNQDTSPRSLTDIFGADWLSQFSLGDLFAHLEFGSNRERPAGP